MVDIYENDNFFGYKDSYNYYDIDVHNILLFKKSYNEYFIRYYDANKIIIASLQLKIKNFFGDFHTFASNNRVMSIYSDDKEFSIKYREIWNKITELITINNAPDIVETTLNDNADEFITIDFESKLIYGYDDDNKYIKTKMKKHTDSIITNFHKKNTKRKSTLYMSINNNARFCY